MSLNTVVSQVLNPILTNNWMVELPSKPSFPAMVWSVETDPEDDWCDGAGYDQHTVTVFILCEDDSLSTLLEQVRQGMQARAEFLREGESGDAEFEEHPDTYAKFAEFVIRLPQH